MKKTRSTSRAEQHAKKHAGQRESNAASRSKSALRLLAMGLIATGVAALLQRLSVHLVNDSVSYQAYPFGSLPDAMLSTRTPAYPAFLWLIQNTAGIKFIPLIQVLLHALACWAFGEELLRRAMPAKASFCAASCVLVGCTFVDHVHTVSTDCPAASLGVLTATLLMTASRTKSLFATAGCSLLALLAIAMRPAYLFLIPWLWGIGWLLSRMDQTVEQNETTKSPGRWLGVAISMPVILVLLAWMTARKAVVDDFGLIPFGHQNLSAILVQTIPLSKLHALDGDGGELATRVAEELERQRYETPEANAGLSTLIIESQWDRINYEVIWPAARALEASRDEGNEVAQTVRVHRLIADMNRKILLSHPGGYARWLVLATRRAVWGSAANISMHVIFLPIILLSTAVLFWKCNRAASWQSITVIPSWKVLVVVGISYAVMKIGFIILTSPPLGRFADAGTIFLPAILVTYVLLADSTATAGGTTRLATSSHRKRRT